MGCLVRCERLQLADRRLRSSAALALVRAHLHLYSPTQILHPTSKSISGLIGDARSMEREAKSVLSSDAAARVETSVEEKERIGRLRQLLLEVRDEKKRVRRL